MVSDVRAIVMRLTLCGAYTIASLQVLYMVLHSCFLKLLRLFTGYFTTSSVLKLRMFRRESPVF